jgi:dienelactone hydrolase
LSHRWARVLRATLGAAAVAVASQAAVLAADGRGSVAPTLAEEVTELPGLSRLALRLAIRAPDGRATTLEALVIRPDGPGPFPLVLITHGMPRSAADIPLQRPEIYSSPAIVFAQRGYAAVIVMRHGYGRSDGPFAEHLGPCDARTYLQAGNAAAADVLAALAVLRKEPWVDPARVVLVGHSMGGFAVLAASAANPPGVLGIISFAGAVGSPRPDYVCQTDRLIEADRAFGQSARVPGLWIFAQNDHLFGPDLAKSMFDAYVANGAPASLFEAPSFGRDGHSLIWSPDGTAWWPRVAALLESLHLPTAIQVPLAAPAPLPEPVPLDDAGHAAFAIYQPSRSYEKAFATDAAGHYGMALSARTKADAVGATLKDCQKMERVCRIYAVGNELAPAGGPPGPEPAK